MTFQTGSNSSAQTKNFSIALKIHLAACKVIKSYFGSFNDVIGNKGCAFRRALRGTFHATFPLKCSPTFIAGLRQERENSPKIDLAVTQRTEPTCASRPRLISSINAHSPGWSELSILDVKSLYAFAIKPDKFKVVQLLQQKVARIVIQTGCRVVVRETRETFRR